MPKRNLEVGQQVTTLVPKQAFYSNYVGYPPLWFLPGMVGVVANPESPSVRHGPNGEDTSVIVDYEVRTPSGVEAQRVALRKAMVAPPGPVPAWEAALSELHHAFGLGPGGSALSQLLSHALTIGRAEGCHAASSRRNPNPLENTRATTLRLVRRELSRLMDDLSNDALERPICFCLRHHLLVALEPAERGACRRAVLAALIRADDLVAEATPRPA